MSLLAFFTPPPVTSLPSDDVEPYFTGVATRGRFTSRAVTTTEADRVRLDRSRHQATGKIISLQLHWLGVYMDPGTQLPIPNSISRSVEVVYPSGQRVPFTFGGGKAGTLAGGSWLATDELTLPVPIPAGSFFYLETRSEVQAGQMITVADGDYLDTSRNEGVKIGSATSFSSGFGVFPQVIAGRTVTAGVTSMALIGDSIMTGARDNFWGAAGTGGFGDRFALRVGAGWANYARGGDAARIMTTEKMRFERFGDTLKIHDVVLSNYGTNDWWGSTSVEMMQGNLLSLWGWVRGKMKPGAKFFTTTSSPWSRNVTDNFVTHGGQSPHSRDWIRTGYNRWLRDGAPVKDGAPAPVGASDAIRAGEPGHPLDGWVEMTDIVESSRDSGVWGSRGRKVTGLSLVEGSREYASPDGGFTAADVGVTCAIYYGDKSMWVTIREVLSSTRVLGSWASPVTDSSAWMAVRINDFTSDALHPSPYGYHLIADNLQVPGLTR